MAKPIPKYDFAKLLDGAVTQDETYLVEYANLEFTELVLNRMRELGINNAELAQRLRWQSGRVSAFLDGAHPPNLRTMVRVAKALGMRVEVKFAPAQAGNA